MNQIRMVKDEIGNVYLSQEDLMSIFAARMELFPEQLEALKGIQVSTLVGANGQPISKPSDPVEVARHEGKRDMLEGIMGIINVVDEE